MPNPTEEFAQPESPETVSDSRSAARTRIAIIVVLLAIAGAAYAVYMHYRDQVSTDDAEVDGHIGAIAPKISGNVLEVLVDDNQEVAVGQPLVRIDPRDYQARVDIAKAELARAESQLRSARVVVPWTDATTQSGSGVAAAQLADAEAELARARLAQQQSAGSDLAYAEANMRAKQAKSDRAQADLARMKPLADKAEISQLQFDAYAEKAKEAESDLEAAREKLASAREDAAIRKSGVDAAATRVSQAQAEVAAALANRQQVGIRSADAGTAAAAVETARANLAAAELQLSYCAIVSPIEGVVTRKSVEVGQIVAPGQGLMTVIPLHDTWVTANFKETQLENVHTGQRAEIHVDMYGRSIAGRVDSIAGSTGSRMSLLPPENATGNFVKVVQRIPVKILVDRNERLILRPGMNADVTIFTK
ncbi:MAG: HlyD family secretion protein [Bryobacteraceae bacterium]|jgi:membrane fusion protein (multidrug efflux system)